MGPSMRALEGPSRPIDSSPEAEPQPKPERGEKNHGQEKYAHYKHATPNAVINSFRCASAVDCCDNDCMANDEINAINKASTSESAIAKASIRFW